MKILLVVLRKEFSQIFRDPAILRIIFVVPMIQLLLLPLAADYEVRNIYLAVVDNDRSELSGRLVRQLAASTYFRISEYARTYPEALAVVEKDAADVILEIPANFERQLLRGEKPVFSLSANAANGVRGSLGGAYAAAILRSFVQAQRASLEGDSRLLPLPVISTEPLFLFNPFFNYKAFMVPGILAILVTMVGSFLTALNIVREKEVGTIEQLNVTPITKRDFILGKLIPFWVLGLLVLGIGLLVGYLFFGVWPRGSLLTLFVVSAVYLPGVLGIGMLISTYADTQQQASLMSFFAVMIFVLMSGLYTPVESMPDWAQWLAAFNPPTYFVEAIRMIALKGSRLPDMWPQLAMMGLFGIFFNSWAVWNYRKTLQ